jgi:hypothetical protein
MAMALSSCLVRNTWLRLVVNGFRLKNEPTTGPH